MKIKKYLIFLVIFFYSYHCQADWQSDLESHFDIADTFDQYQDWVGSSNNGGCTNLTSCDLPKMTDGSTGQWDMYEDYSKNAGCLGPQPGDKWISNFGSDFRWSGEKSLRMSYSDPLIGSNSKFDVRLDFKSGGSYQPQIGDIIFGQESQAQAKLTGIIKYPDWGAWVSGDALGEFYITEKTGTFFDGERVTINGQADTALLVGSEQGGFSNCSERLGPNRLGMYFGNGRPESGYDEIHLFFMVKFPQGSIKYLPQAGRYAWIGTWKFFELEQGFININDWEEGADRQMTCQCAQDLSAYGVNFLITNIAGGGFSYSRNAYLSTQLPTAGYADGSNPNYGSFCGLTNCWTYKRSNYDDKDYVYFPSNNFLSEYEKGNWIGMEARWKIGTLDSDDAEYEEWLYDQSGQILAHGVKTGMRAKRQFDNRVNKFVLGGNRFAQTYGLQEGDAPDGSFYIDDLIIDDQRVGPAYFSFLSGSSDAIAPGMPKGLSVK